SFWHITQPISAGIKMRLSFHYKVAGNIKPIVHIQLNNEFSLRELELISTWNTEPEVIEFVPPGNEGSKADFVLKFEVAEGTTLWLDEFSLVWVGNPGKYSVELAS